MDIQKYISSGIIESYVMGLCNEAEEKELETLRTQYPELNSAILSFESEMEKNMLRQSTLPDEATDYKILTLIDDLKKPAAVIPIQEKKNNWRHILSIAASVLLLISAGFNYYLYQQTKNNKSAETTVSLPASDYEIMKKPSITPVAMYGYGFHAICRCTMFWDKATGKAYIMIHHLPKSSAAKSYQLWAMIDGKPVNVGIIDDEIRGRFIEMTNLPSSANAFTVTLEKAGGALTPTESEIYLTGKI